MILLDALEWLSHGITGMTSAVAGALPVLPYLFTAVVVYATMNRVIKPFVRSHVTPDNKFTNKFWLWADKLLFLYPVILGVLCDLFVRLTFPAFSGVLFYFIGSGMASSWIFLFLKHWFLERGISLPSDFSEQERK